MREELKNYNWFTYGLSANDFLYTIELIDHAIEASLFRVNNEIERVKSQHEEENVVEIISDISHYAYKETNYLWHFCLMRLQGIFEGIITEKILERKELPGLKTKLKEASRIGYELDNDTYCELIEWSNLRNALSHNPPEMYRPQYIDRSDILEFKELLEGVLSGWGIE